MYADFAANMPRDFMLALFLAYATIAWLCCYLLYDWIVGRVDHQSRVDTRAVSRTVHHDTWGGPCQ